MRCTTIQHDALQKLANYKRQKDGTKGYLQWFTFSHPAISVYLLIGIKILNEKLSIRNMNEWVFEAQFEAASKKNW